MDVVLVMFMADGTRRDFTLSRGRTVVGRTVSCGLRVPLAIVSRKHCEITIDQDAVHLRDLGSSNGTFHNGARVQEADLAPGDQISVGPVKFIVVVDGKPEKIDPVPTIIPAHKATKPKTRKKKELPLDASALAVAALEDSAATASLDSGTINLDGMSDSQSAGGGSSGNLPLILDDEEDDKK
ncbi:MAG: FHA domain-containing protein [Phycisphaeraceae bacterium]|nr:FHA domain-containing protein [Phycisphaeraceae bacterium]